MQEFIQNNPMVFMGVVIGIAIIIGGILVASFIAQKKKKNALLESDPNLVEIIFDEIVQPADKMFTDR